MKNTFTKILLCSFALLATSVAFGATSDEISSVTCSGTTFTIKRTTATYATTVYYRTCNGSAVGGIHFQEKSGSISFAAGQKEATVTITKLSPAETTIDAYDENTDRYFYLEVWNSCTTPKFAKATISSNIYVSRYSIYDKYTEKTPGSYYGLGLFDERDEFNYDFTVFTSQFDATRKKYLAAVGQPYRYAVRCGGWYYKRPYNNYMSPDETYMRLFSEPGGKSAYTGGFKMIRPLETTRYFDFPLNDVSDYLDKSTVINPWGHSYSDELTYQYVFTYFTRTINYNKWVIFPATSTGVLLQVYLGGAGSGDALCQPYVFVCLYDNEAPRLMSISVNDEKIYTSGEKIYLSAKFDEIVKVTSSSFTIPVQIGTTTYNFAYEGGSGTNTLYFSASPTLPSSVTTSVNGMVSQQWSYDSYSKITDWTGNQADIYYTAGDITIGQKYTVTLNANSGSINCNDVKYYTYGVGATLPTNVTRTGYTFDGWYTASSGGSKVNSIGTTETGNKTYYAHWTANKYLVSFDHQSASSPGTASVNATYGSTMPSITPPTKKGYTFGGYFTETNGSGTQYYYASGNGYRTCYLTSPITLYAKWTVKTPTVTLDNQSATTSGSTSVTATYGSNMPSITIPTKTGYTFGGYFTSTNGAGTQYYLANGTSAKPSDLEIATTLYAKWTVNTYAVTLNNQSATTAGSSSVTATYNSAMPTITLPSKTGYTFNGYYTSTSGSGTKYYNANGSSARNYTLTSGTTLYAYWTKDTYTITYNNNGGTISGSYATTYQYGNSVTLPTNVTRNGCTFGGWFNTANCEGTRLYTISSSEVGNKTFYARWTPNTYTVTLNKNGGDIVSGAFDRYTYGVGAILPLASGMKKDGFCFAGWYDNEDFEGDAITEITVADYDNKEYWAKWEEGSYPVVLNTNEGIINSGNVVSYKHGTAKTLPTDVTRTGYTFEGWYENSSCIGSKVEVIPASAVDAKTFWAKWREQVYTIAFEPNDGIINDEVVPTNYTFSVGATLPLSVTKNGYAFAGWYDNEDFEGQPVALVRSSDFGNKTYYAKWNLKTYSIEFHNNGGDIDDEVIPSSYTYNDEVELPYEVYKNGYEFLGWYDNPNFYNEPIDYIEVGEFGNKTFYAKWQVKNYGISYIVNGGTINSGNVTNYTYGYGISLPTDVTRTGYTFSGWYSDASFTSNRIYSISSDEMGYKTFYAKWTANHYTVTLYPNDGTIRSGNVGSYVYGSSVTLPTDIVRMGYTFDGWYSSPNMDGLPVTKITATDNGNKSYYAKWSVKIFTVELDAQGGTINSGNVLSYIYGVGAMLPSDVTKKGNTFKGWECTSENYTYTATLVNYGSSKLSVIKAVKEIFGYGLLEAKNIVDALPGTPFVLGVELSQEEADALKTTLEDASGIVEIAAIGDGSAGQILSSLSALDYGNKTFDAVWEANNYSVVFNTVGGMVNDSLIEGYTFGEGVKLPTDVTRMGHTFGGWYTNSSYDGIPYDTIMPTEVGNREYWAKWNVNTYNVSFEPNGGVIKEGAIDSYVYGVGALLPTNVTKDGYTFDGWYDNNEFAGERVSMISTASVNDQNFYAKWTIVDYTITYNNKGGVISGDYAVGYNIGDTVVLPQTIARTGYEFAGWFNNSNCEGTAVDSLFGDETGNKEFWAKWLVNTYDVTLDANGGTINSGNVTDYTYGYGAVLPTEISRVGYTFAGWYNADGERVVRITEDDFGEKSFTAQWTPNKYTITFVTNDGTITGEYPTTYSYDEGVELPTEIVKNGYAFRGWFANSNFDGEAVTAISATDLGNKMFWAQWERISYGVILNANGGVIKSGNVTTYSLGATTILPVDVVKTGYTFEGWFDNAEWEGEQINTIGATETGNKQFFAKWSKIDYTIVYNANGGTIEGTPQASYNYGETVALPTASREGYTFAGWYDNSNFEGAKVSSIAETETGDKEYWAKWIVKTYGVTLVENGGTINSGNVTNYVFGNIAILPVDITKTGYSFAGWFDNAECTGEAVTGIAETETGAKTFYAKWTPNQYTITFSVNGGKISGDYPATYNYGESVALPLTIEKTGSEFKGWFTNSNFDGDSVKTIAANDLGNKIFWAKWEKITYSVALNINGGTINSGAVTAYNYGNTVILPTDVAKTGLKFEGWYDNADFNGEAVQSILPTETGDKEFFAKWTEIEYAITLNVNGGAISGDYATSYKYGMAVELPTEVTKEGCTFEGWYTNSNGDGLAVSGIEPTDLGSKTFWAIWTVNNYKVSVTYDNAMGSVEGAGNYRYNRQATLTAKSDDGYEFTGWETESTLNVVSLQDSTIQFIVTDNVALTANFKKKEIIYAVNKLMVDTLKTGVQNEPISLSGLFKASEDGQMVITASSSNPSIVVADVVDGKLYLTTNQFKGVAEVTLTAKLANGNKASLTTEVVVEYDCDITIADVAITNVSCYGLADGKIELTAAEDAEYSYQWINSESTANVLEDVVAGNYQVVITDEHLCEITKTYTVSQPDEIIAEIASFRKPKCGGTDGEITVSAAAEYNYLWSNGATSKDLTEVGIGDYTVKVTDPANGCFITLAQSLEYPENPTITVEAVEKTRCDQSVGAVIVNVDNEVSYNWTSAGETISTEQNLGNVPAGFYTLTVTDGNNCSSVKTVEVKNFEVQVPQISLVTVSRQTGKNLIVWVRENTDLIDYYTIYREDSVSNEFNAIGTVKHSEISVFEDEDADPMKRQWSYRITATDICGNETAMSETHTTLHLNEMKSLREGQAELIWQPYVGVDYRSFYIVRETKVGSYTFIDTVTTVPASATAYTPEIPSVGRTIFYVGIKLNEVIDPKDFMKAESGPFALALSNIAEAENMDQDAVSDLENSVVAYAVGHTIYVKNADGKTIELYDASGRKINTATGNEVTEFSVRLDGIYFVKVEGETFKVIVR